MFCGWSTPVLGAGNDKVIATCFSLHAFDADLTERWSFDPASEGWVVNDSASAGLGSDGRVYASFDASPLDSQLQEGVLFAVNDGTKLWEVEIGSKPTSPAIGIDGTIFIADQGTYDNQTPGDPPMLWAVSPSGQVVWSLQLHEGAATSPVIGSDGTVYVATMDGYLYAVAPGTGNARSSFLADVSVQALALSADGTLYVGGSGNHAGAVATIFAVDAKLVGVASITSRWSSGLPQESSVNGLVIGADGTVYASSSHLYAIAPDGTVAWTSDESSSNGGFSAPAMGSNGTIYVQDGYGTLFAFGK
jgi:outer membrane protein assembly factor BamB